MKKILAVLLSISLLILSSCTMLMPAEEKPAEGSVQAAVGDVEQSIESIDQLNVENLEKELDISELGQLEKDLEEINW